MGRDEFRIKIALTYNFIWNFFRLVFINITKTEKKSSRSNHSLINFKVKFIFTSNIYGNNYLLAQSWLTQL